MEIRNVCEFIIDIKNIRNSELLTKWKMDTLISIIIDKLGLNVINRMYYSFDLGCSISYFLKEGHLNLCAVPNQKACFINIFFNNYNLEGLPILHEIEHFLNVESDDIICDVVCRGCL